MSSEQSSVNSETLEQTKQQIRGLVSEIAQLSKSGLSAEEYYAAFLQRIVSALAAVGGAVWVHGDSRRLELRYQINLSETLLDSSSEEASRHVRLLHQVVQTGEPQLTPPQSGQEAGNPTNYLLVLAPLICDGQVEGVLEVFQRPDSQPATQRGYLRFLIQMAELAAEWLKSQKLKAFSDRHSLWAKADHFARLVHEGLETRETAYTIVNEGRRLIGCDRVSVALKRGTKCVVEAISGQDTMENRSNIVNSLNRLASKVVATEEPLWFDGNSEDLPPQVEEAVDDYVEESYAKTITVLPIRRPKTIEERTDDRATDTALESNLANKVIGALIIEQIETDLPREVLAPRADLVYEHAARALSNSMDHNSVFLLPLFRAIGKSKVIVETRNLPKTITVTAAIVLVLLGLFVWPADFDISAKGALQPTVRHDIFANSPGRIDVLKVRDKATVRKDDVLVVMENEDLKLEMTDIEGRKQSTLEQLNAANRSFHDKRMSAYDRIQLGGDIKRLTETYKSLSAQHDLLKQKEELLTVRSPIDGQVILNWDVEKSLVNRSVDAGQVLMTVADMTGEWELELFVPERRIGHVNKARAAMQPNLTVEYILATDPGTHRAGSIEKVHGSTQMHDSEGSTVRIKVEIEKDDIPDRRPGATVTADVKCGTASFGYTWFYEVIEWVHANVLF
ncbi:MAG: HlyD family efflux transporter periplasmic adaptor subunit [Pirellulaceae bacterium]|jgi:multidrug efflux pump subunit AcrA (membrane-fusion protein)|nr:HlyD family efflux transporter periplasmic adaptor subunit [Pirellulaceae bacterium]